MRIPLRRTVVLLEGCVVLLIQVVERSFLVLLMEDILHHLGCIKPCEYQDKFTNLNWFAGFLPSNVLGIC